MKLMVLILICMQFYFINCYIIDPGPQVKPTQGEIWPKPFQQKSTNYFSLVRPNVLKFRTQSESCNILNEAIIRYKHIIERMLRHDGHEIQEANTSHIVDFLPYNSLFAGYIDVITINLNNACEEQPHPNMVEEYKLSVRNSTAYLESESIWGILRGLESFSQLLVVSPDRTTLRVNETAIHDKPRYSYRGLLIDTSRHFINIDTLKKILDGMAYNKLNVFHWHIVDDHSFPYESITFPELSKRGSYTPDRVYSQSQIKEIIEYARLRGIRTLAEFDTPGHTRSWGISHPEILTACEKSYSGKLGPIDPTKPESYDFMQKLLTEVVNVFPDEYVHLGGDEVGFECWKTSSRISNFMKSHNMTKYEQVEEIYIQRIVDMVKNLSRKSIVWQEAFENGVKLAPDTVVHVWTRNRSRLLSDITKKGYRAILSTCWYLSDLSSGGDWQKYYTCEPSSFPGDKKQKSLLIGGEACMWSEYVNDLNILQRIFPRVSAAAEKLWSQENVKNILDAKRRLEEHACRMNARDIPAQPPNGPGFCA